MSVGAPCPHDDVDCRVEYTRITSSSTGEVAAYRLDVRVNCVGCGTPFIFAGLSPGLDPDRPTTDLVATELRAPIRPSSPDDPLPAALAQSPIVWIPNRVPDEWVQQGDDAGESGPERPRTPARGKARNSGLRRQASDGEGGTRGSTRDRPGRGRRRPQDPRPA